MPDNTVVAVIVAVASLAASVGMLELDTTALVTATLSLMVVVVAALVHPPAPPPNKIGQTHTP